MAEQVFKKETEYGTNENNFIGESEITVTITLNEYRELVSRKATRDKDVNEAVSKANESRIEARDLESENTKLKTEIYELKKKLEAQNGFVIANGVANSAEGVEAQTPEETVEVQTWE